MRRHALRMMKATPARSAKPFALSLLSRALSWLVEILGIEFTGLVPSCAIQRARQSGHPYPSLATQSTQRRGIVGGITLIGDLHAAVRTEGDNQGHPTPSIRMAFFFITPLAQPVCACLGLSIAILPSGLLYRLLLTHDGPSGVFAFCVRRSAGSPPLASAEEC